MATIGNLVVHIGANIEELRSGLKGAQGLLDSAASSMGGALKTGLAVGATAAAGAAVAATAAVAGFGVASLNAFVPFQQQMNEVFTLLPGISQQAMGQMTQQVLDFSAKFGVLPEKVVPALYQAISAGVPPENVFSFLGQAFKSSVAGVTDLTTSIDGLTSVVNAYGPEVLSVTQASDIMQTAITRGKTTFDELSSSLFNVVPVAASLKVGFGDVTAAIASMTAQGVPTSVATTQLRQLLTELGDSGSSVAKAFETAAGQSFPAFIAQGGNLQGALTILSTASSEGNMRISELFGSVEAGNAALALTGTGATVFSANLGAMTNSSGAATTAFETMNGGLGRSMERMKAFGETILIQTGQALAPLLDKLVELGEGAMPTIQAIFTQARPIIEAFANELGTNLGPAALIIIDAIQRMAIALGLTTEKTSGTEFVVKALKGTLDLVVTGVKAAAVTINLLADGVEAVSKFVRDGIEGWKRYGDALNGLASALPSWLMPGSPTPLELGLRGLSAAVKELPDLQDKFNVPGLAEMGASTGSAQATYNNQRQYNLTIHTANPMPLVSEYAALEAMA